MIFMKVENRVQGGLDVDMAERGRFFLILSVSFRLVFSRRSGSRLEFSGDMSAIFVLKMKPDLLIRVL